MFNLRSAIRKTCWTVLIIVVLIGACVGEELLRIACGGSMTIGGLPLQGVDVKGEWHPDFMWMGRAWMIEVRSDADVRLILDGRTFVIPKGTHVIYSNHDSTNTGQFGKPEFWGYPKVVKVSF
ncbi:MAG: hypothetical protein JNM43_15100 [Planctomycetaceae bacterium]|nr:hypothetical protein [Planctomycetaceae bacterium]